MPRDRPGCVFQQSNRTEWMCSYGGNTQQAVTTVCHVIIIGEEKQIFSIMENEVVMMLSPSTLMAQLCPNSEEPEHVTLTR